jgi:hypothetical protein
VKQKWERIVHHRFVRENTAATENDPNPNLAIINSSTLEGIKESIKEGMEGVSKGVGRLISAGISAPQTPPSGVPPLVTSRTHSSHSSASTVTTTTVDSSVRLSQSSISSWDDDPWAQPPESCEQSPVRETSLTNDDGADHSKPSTEGETDKELSAGISGIGTSPSPDALLSPSAFSFTAEFVAAHPSSHSTTRGASTNPPPPPASVPGVSSLVPSTGAVQPVSSLVISATKKWNELQRTPT